MHETNNNDDDGWGSPEEDQMPRQNFKGGNTAVRNTKPIPPSKGGDMDFEIDDFGSAGGQRLVFIIFY